MQLSRKIRRFYAKYTCVLNSSLLCLILLVFISIHLNLICVNLQAWRHATRMCSLHQESPLLGALCRPLCNSEMQSLSCHPASSKQTVFSAYWNSNHIVFKKASSSSHTPLSSQSEPLFLASIGNLLKSQLNLSATVDDIEPISHMRAVPRDSRTRKKEIEELWRLLQDREYLLLAVFAHADLFPKLLGNCGPYYAIEYVEPVQELSVWSVGDGRESWGRRVKVALMILELLEEMDKGFHEPFQLCDVKLEDFGILHGTTGPKMKFVDLDYIFTKSILDQTLSTTKCRKDEDCDLKDCRSSCVKGQCTVRKNDNFQIVCEKIFLGWRMSNRLIVPGLLTSEHTPADLSVLLRHCANPLDEMGTVRMAPVKDVVGRLEGILADIDQGFGGENV